MKNKSIRNLLIAFLWGMLFLSPITSFSATYTAVVSGNWTSTLTWGGAAPPATISGNDAINISAGVTVILDVDVEINNTLASINLLGTLESTQNNCTVTAGTIIGTGNLIVAELIVSAQGTVATTGAITCDVLESASSLLVISASTSIQSELKLTGGICQIDNSGNIMLASDATIHLAGGALQVNGSLVASGSYNLIYSGSSTSTGDETDGGTIANLTVNLSNSNETLMMDGNLTVNDTLSLVSGHLDMNGFDLTLNGNTQAQGSASISGDANSNITINGSGNVGILVFTSGDDQVNDCTINIGNSGSVTLETSLTVNGMLSLHQGNCVLLDGDLTVAASGSIQGQSDDSYINTSGDGHLVLHLQAGGSSIEYPVGSDEGYFPCILTQNQGASDTEIKVQVFSGVFANGTTGTDLTSTASLVNHTWIVSETDANAQVDLDFEFAWDASAQVNGFDQNNCFISHYVNGAWDVTASASAQVNANGQLSITRENITSLSPFRVADDSSVGIVDFEMISLKLYPNPSGDYLSLELPLESNFKVARIFDAQGKLLLEKNLNTSTVQSFNISVLPAGQYFMKLDHIAKKVFVKK